jgi:hypothetical protein
VLILETKAVVPPIATLGLGTLAGATVRVLEAFGWVHLTATETGALAGFGVALLPVVSAVLAYLLPHTSRPDLTGAPAPATRTDVPGATVKDLQPAPDGGVTVVTP